MNGIFTNLFTFLADKDDGQSKAKGIKPYKCNDCGFKTKRLNELKIHQDSLHF